MNHTANAHNVPQGETSIYYFKNWDKYSFTATSYFDAVDKADIVKAKFGRAININGGRYFYFLKDGEKFYI